MDLISLLVVCIVVGVVLYLITLIPMDDRIKQAITVIAIALIVIEAIRLLLGGGLPLLHR